MVGLAGPCASAAVLSSGGFDLLIGMAVAAALLVPAVVMAAAAAPGPHKALYLYEGADRDKRILEGARKEKQLLIYTSLNLKDSLPIKEVFEKKYGVRLEIWRSSSEKVLQRALTAPRAGPFAVDAFQLNAPELDTVSPAGLL